MNARNCRSRSKSTIQSMPFYQPMVHRPAVLEYFIFTLYILSMATLSLGFVRLLCVAILLTAGACTYPISKQLRQAAGKENLNFSLVFENPAAYTGRIVLWGGKIIETTNVRDGTEMIILDVPLDFWGEPKEAQQSRGRFIARSVRFLDPAVYRPDREITLAAEVSGAEQRPLGATTYRYPVVMIKELYLWEPYYYHHAPYYPHYYWDYPFWGPYYYCPVYYRDWDHYHHKGFHGGHYGRGRGFHRR